MTFHSRTVAPADRSTVFQAAGNASDDDIKKTEPADVPRKESMTDEQLAAAFLAEDQAQVRPRAGVGGGWPGGEEEAAWGSGQTGWGGGGSVGRGRGQVD